MKHKSTFQTEFIVDLCDALRMSARAYIRAWLLLLIVCGGESFMLNHYPESGILGTLQRYGYLSEFSLDPAPGRPVSLFLGWAGFGTILLTNLYILRKRTLSRTQGSLKGWLNFHIFCGLVGPTLIVFHTNFKVGGLVAIAFWSMIVSLASGLIGRYLYSHISFKRADLEQALQVWDNRFSALSAGVKVELPGWVLNPAIASPSALGSLWITLRQDGSLLLRWPQLRSQLGHESTLLLVRRIRGRRRLQLFEQFRRLIGYWHAVHAPFAAFLYAVAIIHILTATIFAVSEAERSRHETTKLPVARASAVPTQM